MADHDVRGRGTSLVLMGSDPCRYLKLEGGGWKYLCVIVLVRSDYQPLDTVANDVIRGPGTTKILCLAGLFSPALFILGGL